MSEQVLSSFADVASRNLGQVLVLGLFSVLALVAALWLVRFMFHKGKVLATFSLGLMVAVILFGWVIPWPMTTAAASTASEVVLKPLQIGRGWGEYSQAEMVGAVMQVLGWSVVHAFALGLCTLVLVRERRAAYVASLLGVTLAGGMFALGVMV